MIDEKVLLDRLGKIEEHCLEMSDWKGQSAIEEAIEIANQLVEENNNGWIPCSVRLPEEPEIEPMTLEEIENTTEYIVMIAGATVPTTLHYLGNGVWWHDTYYKVTAWQPLPPAYITEGVDND